MRHAARPMPVFLPLMAIILVLVWTATVTGSGQTRAQIIPICVEPDFGPAVGPQQLLILRCLVIIKDTDPEGAGGNFEFEGSIPGGDFSFSLADDQQRQIGVAEQGDYTITEDVPGGWNLDIDCIGASGVIFAYSENSVTVTFGSNVEAFSAECIFTNEQEEDEEEEDPTATPTRTPTQTPTVTPTSTPTGADLGGLAFPLARRDTPTPTAAVAPVQPGAGTQTVRPPSTGNAGLLTE